MKKIILLLVLGIFFVNFVSAESCVSDLKINFGVYETYHMEDNSKLYIRSFYQPSGSDKFVRRSDVLFIESVYAEAKHSCNKIDSVTIQFKRPNSDDWGEDLSITLDFTNSNVYSLELVDIPKFDSIIYRDINGKDVHPPPRKTLSNEGIWEFRVVDVEGKARMYNDGWWIPGEILVMDRLAVTQLETLRQIQDGNNKSSFRNRLMTFLIGIISVAAVFLIGYKQLNKMDEHYDKQTEKEDRREEGRQLDLLKTLVVELDFLEKNLKSYKETFSRKSHYPFYELWDIDVAFYLRNLNHKIKDEDTAKLKGYLMKIKDKLLIIINMKVESKKDEETRGEEKVIQIKIESIRKGVINMIDEDIFPLIKKSKKLIKEISSKH